MQIDRITLLSFLCPYRTMKSLLLLPLLGLLFLASIIEAHKSIIEPTQVNLTSRVPHMVGLVKQAILPSDESLAAISSLNTSISSGISLKTLRSLQNEWITTFDWENEQAAINKYCYLIVKY